MGAYLFTVGGLGVVGWMLSAWMVVRGNRSTRATVTTLLGISALVALAHLTVSEYGSTILAPAAGWVTLLLCLPGLVATVLLWRTAV